MSYKNGRPSFFGCPTTRPSSTEKTNGEIPRFPAFASAWQRWGSVKLPFGKLPGTPETNIFSHLKMLVSNRNLRISRGPPPPPRIFRGVLLLVSGRGTFKTFWEKCGFQISNGFLGRIPENLTFVYFHRHIVWDAVSISYSLNYITNPNTALLYGISIKITI